MPENPIPKVHIVGIPIFAGRFKEAIDHVLHDLGEAKNNCISATGAHGIVHSTDDQHFKEILQGFYLNLPDGMPNVWIGKLKGKKRMERCYGPDFFAEIMKVTANKNVNHFFCGGKEGVAENLKNACFIKFHNHNIMGTYCPPFLNVDQYDYKEIGQIINKVNTDILWIGLSTPKQEFFAHYLSSHVNVKFIIAVGAAFDFHTDAVRQAPNWIQKAGLEWLFRLITEPKRLFARYIYIVPKYLYLNLADFIKFVTEKRK
jgi:N-acetylglucosaminyldiphosphoundecaprenol N-acetyl-beta-D-mannosaminyltransferase